jgi:hypothetical protein
MARNIYELSLRSVIPSSLAGDPQVQAMIDALDPELRSVSFDTRKALIYSQIDELPENVVDLLALQFHVDFYEPERLSLESKRNLVKSSILVHRRKGTKWAVEEILRSIGIEPEITEWFEYGGEPYTFRVNGMIRRPLSPGEMWGGDTYSLARRAIMETKSERSWLESLNLGILFDFGDIILSFPEHFRREFRQGRAVWSFLPSFDFLSADAMPLDWHPWKGYLRQLRTMRTEGWLTGVSRLDRYLRFDHAGADFLPLDITMPYSEIENPPILDAFFRWGKRTASVSIRDATIGKFTRTRREMFATLSAQEISRGVTRQLIVAVVSGRLIGISGLDRYLSFDAIPSDFLPLDTAAAHREADEPPIMTPLRVRQSGFMRRTIREPTSLAGGTKARSEMKTVIPPPSTRGHPRQFFSGTLSPDEVPSRVDSFLTFDSTPADLAPLDKALPHWEGNFIWR